MRSILLLHFLRLMMIIVFTAATVANIAVAAAVVVEEDNNNDYYYSSTSYFGGVQHASYLQWVASTTHSASSSTSSSASSVSSASSSNNKNPKEASFSYEHSTFLPNRQMPSTGCAVHWSIVVHTKDDDNDNDDKNNNSNTNNNNNNSNNSFIEMAVVVRGKQPRTWMGFGISENGGMKGADMWVYQHHENDNTNNTNTHNNNNTNNNSSSSSSSSSRLQDLHVLGDRLLRVDDCQDWVFVNVQHVQTTKNDENDHTNDDTTAATTATAIDDDDDDDEDNNHDIDDNDIDSDMDDDAFWIVQVRRLLDTGDAQDWVFVNDSLEQQMPVSRIMCAWGPEQEQVEQGEDEEASDTAETTTTTTTRGVGYHGPRRVARGAVRFWQTSSMNDKNTNDPQDAITTTTPAAAAATTTTSSSLSLFDTQMQEYDSFFIAASNYNIPAQETEYALLCFSGNDLRDQGVDLDTGVTVVGFAPVLDHAEHVHHLAILASTNENNNKRCRSSDYREITYTWAAGEPPLALPDNVGLTVGGGSGGGGGYRSFMLEVHYDNPQLLSGIQDSSGVRYYYTTQPRQHRMGIFAMGDAWIRLAGQSVGRGNAVAHRFDCPSSCSSLALQEPVTVLREYHHMHESGISMWSQLLRDGQVVRTGKTEYFDYSQQGEQVVQKEPFTVLPGDAFQIQCTYSNPNQDREFGLSSREEMCIQYLLYYPLQEIETRWNRDGTGWMCIYEMSDVAGVDGCNAEHYQIGEIDEATMQRTFGSPTSECLARPEEWTDAPSAVPTFSPVNDPTLSPSKKPVPRTTAPTTVSPTSLPTGAIMEGEQIVELESVLITFVRSNRRRRHLQEQAGWLLSNNDERAALLTVTSLHLMTEIPYLLATDLAFTRVYTPLADDRMETLALEGRLFFAVHRDETEHSYFAPTMVRSQVKQAFQEKGAVERYMNALKATNEGQLATMQTVYTGFPSLHSSMVGEEEKEEDEVFWMQWEEPLWLIFVGCVGSVCVGLPLLVCFVCCRRLQRRRAERLRLLKASQSNETALSTPDKSSVGQFFEKQPPSSNEPIDTTSSEADKSEGSNGNDDEESNLQQMQPLKRSAATKEPKGLAAKPKKDGLEMISEHNLAFSEDLKLEITDVDGGGDSGQANQPRDVTPDETSTSAAGTKSKKQDLETPPAGKFGQSVKPQSPSCFHLNAPYTCTSKMPKTNCGPLSMPTGEQTILSGARSTALARAIAKARRNKSLGGFDSLPAKYVGRNPSDPENGP